MPPTTGQKSLIWSAYLAKIARGTEDSREIVWEWNPTLRNWHVLRCEGDHENLSIQVQKMAGHGKVGEILLRAVPSQSHRLDVRFFESSRSIELRLEAEVWELRYLLKSDIPNDTEDYIKDAKQSFRRLQNVVAEMDEESISYTNIKGPKTPIGWNPEKSFVMEFPGGKRWEFTGLFATKEFQKELGNVPNDDLEDDEPSQPIPNRLRKRDRKRSRRSSARRPNVEMSISSGDIASDDDPTRPSEGADMPFGPFGDDSETSEDPIPAGGEAANQPRRRPRLSSAAFVDDAESSDEAISGFAGSFDAAIVGDAESSDNAFLADAESSDDFVLGEAEPAEEAEPATAEEAEPATRQTAPVRDVWQEGRATIPWEANQRFEIVSVTAVREYPLNSGEYQYACLWTDGQTTWNEARFVPPETLGEYFINRPPQVSSSDEEGA